MVENPLKKIKETVTGGSPVNHRGDFTTTTTGTPVADDAHSLTVSNDGPIVLHDVYTVEKLAQFNRERVPERNPHAKGAGAYGVLEVTEDVSAYTKAALFQPGEKTDMVIRFSTVAGEQGSPDTWRDPRGFSMKFYTTEGNYDLVGNNTPIFFIRDGIKFPDFIHSQKRHPQTGLRDHDMQWIFGPSLPSPPTRLPGSWVTAVCPRRGVIWMALDPTPSSGLTLKVSASGSSTTSRPTRASIS